MAAVILAGCAAPPVEPRDDPLLAAALQRAGFPAEIHPWTEIEAAPLPPGTTVVVRSAWDYHRQAARFLDWISRLETAGIPVINPSALIRSTIDKSWLTAERPFGCAVPVTLRVAADAGIITGEAHRRNWNRFVLKPPVSASAEGTFLLHADDFTTLEAALAEQPAHILMQEFLPEIRNGELSLVFFDGRFSHAVRKVPARGDFRVQEEFGSRAGPERPPATAMAAAKCVLGNLPQTPCYARIDGLMRGGEFLLMEVELIEPDLFLRLKPGSAAAFADAIIRRLA